MLVEAHYESLLAPHYAWSVGGFENAVAAHEAWLRTLPLPPAPARVLDLGAGFGAAALPLARAGYPVVAVDSSLRLLDDLRAGCSVPVTTVHADLVAHLQAPGEPAGLVLCLGDTLAHLASHALVTELLAALATRLAPGGLAVLAYRPRRELSDAERFILVRGDATRSMTCVLEPIDELHQAVWDLLHVRDGDQVQLHKSGYRKLRIEPMWLAARAGELGFAVEEAPPWRGMTVQLLRHK